MRYKKTWLLVIQIKGKIEIVLLKQYYSILMRWQVRVDIRYKIDGTRDYGG
jgi:hypothetical protein